MDGNGETPGIWSHPTQKWPFQGTREQVCEAMTSKKKLTFLHAIWTKAVDVCIVKMHTNHESQTKAFIHPGFVHLGSSKRSYGKASNTSLLCCAVVLSSPPCPDNLPPFFRGPKLAVSVPGVLDLLKETVVGKTYSKQTVVRFNGDESYGRIHKKIRKWWFTRIESKESPTVKTRLNQTKV